MADARDMKSLFASSDKPHAVYFYGRNPEYLLYKKDVISAENHLIANVHQNIIYQYHDGDNKRYNVTSLLHVSESEFVCFYYKIL